MYVDIDKDDRIAIHNLTTSQTHTLRIALIRATNDPALLSSERLFAKKLAEQLATLSIVKIGQYTKYEMINVTNE